MGYVDELKDELEKSKVEVKIQGISWMEIWEEWRKARSTSNTTNPWIKSTKHHQTNKSQNKIWYGYFCGNFEIGRKQTKLGLESGGEELQVVNQCGFYPR